jgi:hypothetical protein
MAVIVPFQPHYAAPATAALFALQTQALRLLWVKRGFAGSIGRYLVPCVPTAAFFAFILALPSAPVPSSLAARERAKSWLLDQGGRHLVIVRYGPVHALSNEWVYNDASLDAARVVWARDSDEKGRYELAAYFPDRRIWTVNADDASPGLVELKRPAQKVSLKNKASVEGLPAWETQRAERLPGRRSSIRFGRTWKRRTQGSCWLDN